MMEVMAMKRGRLYTVLGSHPHLGKLATHSAWFESNSSRQQQPTRESRESKKMENGALTRIASHKPNVHVRVYVLYITRLSANSFTYYCITFLGVNSRTLLKETFNQCQIIHHPQLYTLDKTEHIMVKA